MAEAEPTTDASAVIQREIQVLLDRRGAGDRPIVSEAVFAADLGMDSLELAELSAALEDSLGHDPFSEGIIPETVGELVAYYQA